MKKNLSFNKKNKNFKVFKIEQYKIFFKTSIISLIVIFSFFTLPTTLNFLKKNFSGKKIIVNNSNKTFNDTINKGTSKIFKEEERDLTVVLENVFSDVDFFRLKDEGENSSRLSASTIEQLFQDTKYNLKKVRETKVVNIGNSIDHLPKEIKNISNVKKRKQLFIQIVLPLITEENMKIRLDRKKLFTILNRSNNSEKEKQWLEEKFKQYGLKNTDLSSLKIRMDEIPVSLAIAQAAKETGWGTSRFAQQGNALFGQWTWSGEGIKPAGVDSNAKHKVMRFKVLKASVRAYQRNLNTHSSYKSFRKERAIQRDNDQKLNSMELVNFLDKYAETGEEYIKIIKKIIRQNSLTDFDDVEILPTSNKLKSLI